MNNNDTLSDTLICQATLGINPGYYHNNESEINAGITIQRVTSRLFKSGITKNSISFVINKSITVYDMTNGCPYGGEDTITISSTANPKYVNDFEQWQKDCIAVIKALKQELNQTTVLISFYKTAKCLYLTD